jgi:hypothetical protein
MGEVIAFKRAAATSQTERHRLDTDFLRGKRLPAVSSAGKAAATPREEGQRFVAKSTPRSCPRA